MNSLVVASKRVHNAVKIVDQLNNTHGQHVAFRVDRYTVITTHDRDHDIEAAKNKQKQSERREEKNGTIGSIHRLVLVEESNIGVKAEHVVRET